MQTDFYINKVLPVSQFTQLMNVIREIISDEGQLDSLAKLQKKFFYDVAPFGTKKQHSNDLN